MKSTRKFARGLIVTGAVAATALAGCTTTSTTASMPQPHHGHTITRTYSDEDLQASGRATTGEALQQLDPDIQVRRGPH